MKAGVGRKIVTFLGLFLILLSIGWILYAVFTAAKFSMAAFTGIVFGAILLLIGTISPTNQ